MQRQDLNTEKKECALFRSKPPEHRREGIQSAGKGIAFGIEEG